MRFRTPVTVDATPQKIDYRQGITSIGSCFAEEIGGRMKRLKFKIDLNPFGIVYNPASVANSIDLLLGGAFDDTRLVQHDGLWHSLDHHGSYSETERATIKRKIEARIEHSRDHLRNARWLIITLGTAYVYSYNKTGKIVANCHKIPSTDFSRRRLSVNEVVGALGSAIDGVFQANRDINVIVTVSPVRHLKDSAAENQRSKATLLLACDELCTENVQYFPAYEIVMDELRDYRFYAEDLTHPSAEATDYIWERFDAAYFSEETSKLAHGVAALLRGVEHRPLHPDSEAHRKFVRAHEAKLRQFIEEFPFIDW